MWATRPRIALWPTAGRSAGRTATVQVGTFSGQRSARAVEQEPALRRNGDRHRPGRLRFGGTDLALDDLELE